MTGDCAFVLLEPRNKALTSTFGLRGVEAGVVAAVEAPDAVDAAEDVDDAGGVLTPLLDVVVASMEPNDCMGALRGSGLAVEEASGGGGDSGNLSLTEPNFIVAETNVRRH